MTAPVSVVVASRDRPSMLARCLASVTACLREGDEVVVVDSASNDATAVRRTAEEAHARLVRCDLPGVCRARNAGWRTARHEIIAFTDDDVIHDRTWLDVFVRCLAEHPEAAFVTGRICVPAGQHPGPRPVALKEEVVPVFFDRLSVGNIGHSASMVVRRSALETVGGFDEALGAGAPFRSCPEQDLFDRLFLAGFRGRYEPMSVAFHDQWRGRRDLLLLDLRYGFGNGARLAKLVRSDRTRARLAARHAFGAWGLRDLVDRTRARQKTVALGVGARLVATVAGFAVGLRTPVDAGHYALPQSTPPSATASPRGRAASRSSQAVPRGP